jgi:hypothetical protein
VLGARVEVDRAATASSLESPASTATRSGVISRSIRFHSPPSASSDGMVAPLCPCVSGEAGKLSTAFCEKDGFFTTFLVRFDEYCVDQWPSSAARDAAAAALGERGLEGPPSGSPSRRAVEGADMALMARPSGTGPDTEDEEEDVDSSADSAASCDADAEEAMGPPLDELAEGEEAGEGLKSEVSGKRLPIDTDDVNPVGCCSGLLGVVAAPGCTL